MSKTVADLQPVIAVDFDGTCCDHEFPGIGKPKANLKAALTLFRTLGYKILIYTCRTCHWHYDVFGGDPKQPTLEREKVKEMIAWLGEHQIPYDEVDDGSRGKPLAAVYIDDKGMRFEDNWQEIAFWVMNHLPK